MHDIEYAPRLSVEYAGLSIAVLDAKKNGPDKKKLTPQTRATVAVSLDQRIPPKNISSYPEPLI